MNLLKVIWNESQFIFRSSMQLNMVFFFLEIYFWNIESFDLYFIYLCCHKEQQQQHKKEGKKSDRFNINATIN